MKHLYSQLFCRIHCRKLNVVPSLSYTVAAEAVAEVAANTTANANNDFFINIIPKKNNIYVCIYSYVL